MVKKAENTMFQLEKIGLMEKLSGGVSHDLKNLIAVILQGSDFLRRKIDDQEKNCVLTLDYIERSAKKINDIIEILFSFIRWSKIEKSEVNVNYILTTSLFLLKYQISKSHVEVVQDLGKNIPDIKADPNSLSQVFMTIIFSSILSMPAGGRLKVRTYIEKKDKLFVVCEFQDTGKKLAPKNLISIFETPLFSDKRSNRLGLSGVKKIIDKHKAEIIVQNKKDAGIHVRIMFEAIM